MRVLLINPFYPISETPSPPLGLAYLAAALEAAGAEVQVLDYVVFPFDKKHLGNVLKTFNPHLVGATAVTMTVDNALKVLRAVKETSARVPTVMGGPHVTFAAEETLQAHPELDLVVLGEGERTIVELAKAVIADTELSAIPGIAYRDDDTVQITSARPFIQNLDSLPPPAQHDHQQGLPLQMYLLCRQADGRRQSSLPQSKISGRRNAVTGGNGLPPDQSGRRSVHCQQAPLPGCLR